MPTPPYARLGIRVGGGAPQYGGLTLAHGDSIQLVAESTAFWSSPAAIWQIYDYPDGWAGPGAPWLSIAVAQPNGLPDAVIYQYVGNSFPPAFVLPADPLWGKFGCSLRVNNGSELSTLYDNTTGFQILSPQGLMEVGFRETSQFGSWRAWAGVIKTIVRRINTLFAALPSLSNATPQAIGTAAAGVGTASSRDDHVHAIGTNVTFPSAATTTILKGTPPAGAGQDVIIRAGTGGDAGSVGGNLTIGPGIGGTADVVAGGSMTFAMQSDGSASGSLLMTGGTLGTFLTIGYDNAATTLTFLTTKNTLRLNAATRIDFQINGTTEATVTASGVNVVSGNTYSVNGVGHTTAATASSLPFRGASGEASFAYIYPAGTVAASGIVRLPSTAVAVAFRDSGDSVDIDALSVAGDDVVHLAKTNALGASIMGEINVASNAIGFYGVAAQAQPSVVGSRGGNAALDSLLTALDTLGLIVNNTSA